MLYLFLFLDQNPTFWVHFVFFYVNFNKLMIIFVPSSYFSRSTFLPKLLNFLHFLFSSIPNCATKNSWMCVLSSISLEYGQLLRGYILTVVDYLNRAHGYGFILLELNITELELTFGPSRLLSTVQKKKKKRYG